MTKNLWTRMIAAPAFAAALFAAAPGADALTLMLNPATGSPNGEFTFTGTLVNDGSSGLTLANGWFDPLTGPAGADLTTAFTFDQFYGPFNLAPGQTYTGDLFSVIADGSAPLGDYTVDFTAIYLDDDTGGRTLAEANGAVTLAAAPTPEPGGVAILLAGLSALAAMAGRRRVAPRIGL